MCAYQHLQEVGTFTVTAPTRRYLALEHTRGTHTDVSCLSFLWRRVPQVRLGFSFLDTGIHTCSGCEVSNGSVQHINAVSTFNDSCLFASPSSAAVPQRLGRQHNASTESSSAKAEAERDEDKHVGQAVSQRLTSKRQQLVKMHTSRPRSTSIACHSVARTTGWPCRRLHALLQASSSCLSCTTWHGTQTILHEGPGEWSNGQREVRCMRAHNTHAGMTYTCRHDTSLCC